MNKVCLLGRICADLELKTAGSNQYTRFNLAVNRKVSKDEEKKTDFISCVAWNKTAEIINKYFKKGSQIAINGRISTGSYEKEDGSKIYTSDIVIEDFDFVDKKEESTEEKTDAEIVADVVNNDPYEAMSEKVANDEFELPF